MEFSVLGPLEIRADSGGEVTAPVLRRLAAYLLSRAGEQVPAETVAAALWPGAAQASSQRLHVQVHRLRTALGDRERVVLERGGYQLRVLPGELDAERFETLRAEGLEALGAGDSERAARLLRKAGGLWRGEPYADLTDLLALADESGRLSELRASALEALYDAELRCGAGSALVAELADVAARYPLRERFHALLMLALHRADRQSDALEVYRTTRRRLVDELGLEPGRELQRIEASILAGETPELDGVRTVRAVVPAQLPPAVTPFAGRTQELGRLDEALAGDARVAVVAGMAGVGKTALAVHWAHRVRDAFPDGQLYLDLRGFSAGAAVPPAEALAGFLRALGVPPDEIPRAESERLGLYRSMLADRRLLVVLDNGADAAQVRGLLPATAGTLALVTSRDELRGLTVSHHPARVRLAPMSVPEGRGLLAASLGGDRVEREPAATERLVRLCGGLPLPLRIVAAGMPAGAARPIETIADGLDAPDGSGRLAELAIEGDPDTSVRQAFSASYDALGDQARSVFDHLGLITAERFGSQLVASLAGLEPAATSKVLRRLRDVHLVEEVRPDRYRLHDLLRLYAAESGLAQARPERLMDWYLHAAASAVSPRRGAQLLAAIGPAPAGIVVPAFDGDAEALDWFDAEWQALLGALDVAERNGMDRHCWQLTGTFGYYLQVRRNNEDHDQLYRRALAAARASGSAFGEAWLLNLSGANHSMAGRHDEALECFRTCVRLGTEAGDEPGATSALANIGAVLHLLGRPDESLAYRRQALAAHRAAGRVDGVALQLVNLSSSYLRLERFDEALACAEEARSICREAGIRFLEGAAAGSMGESHLGLGDPARAIGLLREAVAVGRELRSGILQAESLTVLALAFKADGQLDAARTAARQAVEQPAGGGAARFRGRLADLI